MMVMTPNVNRHFDSEDFEKYAMGDLPEALAARYEEHLLICESCRQRLQETDDYVRSMQLAGRQLRTRSANPGLATRSPRWMTLLAAAIVIAAVVTFGWMRKPQPPEFAVSLAAMRGTETMATAPAHTRLVLNPVTTGLPAPPYRIEVVDSAGHAVWSGTSPGAKLPPRNPGTYFVRIYTGGSTLLREYGLQIH